MARDGLSVRAISMAVQSGAVVNRPSTYRKGAPRRWWTTRLGRGLSWPGTGLITWSAPSRSVSKP
ncbi:Uncharacterised protein [Mycobacteroides abscessus subsp. abscessus]|nr:Uncharacterised protein [Mycobacteroides abscessus subsp. abscessus]